VTSAVDFAASRLSWVVKEPSAAHHDEAEEAMLRQFEIRWAGVLRGEPAVGTR
jgi:hypothetical protein